MYTVIAGNGKEYGPFDEAQVQEWIRNGFLLPESKIKKHDDASWKTLADFPELTAAAASKKSSRPSKTIMHWVPDYSISFWSIFLHFGRALRFALNNFFPTLCAGIIYVVCCTSVDLLSGEMESAVKTWNRLGALSTFMTASMIIIVTLFSVFLLLLILSGIFYFFLQSIRQKECSMPVIQKAFSNLKKTWPQLGLCSIAMFVIMAIGFFIVGVASAITMGLAHFLLIPLFLYFLIVYHFAVALIIDKELGFWDGIRMGWSAVAQHWFVMICIMAFLVLLWVSGFIVTMFVMGIQNVKQNFLQYQLIGTVVSCFIFPIVQLTFAYMYDDIF